MHQRASGMQLPCSLMHHFMQARDRLLSSLSSTAANYGHAQCPHKTAQLKNKADISASGEAFNAVPVTIASGQPASTA